MTRYLILAFLLTGSLTPALRAGNCPNATELFNTGIVFERFSPGCGLSGTLLDNYPSLGCSRDIWFRFSPNNPAHGYNVRFDINFVQPVTQTNVHVIYSESKDANSPCSWGPQGAQAAFTFTYVSADGFSPHPTPIPFTGSGWLPIWIKGMDGSGVYYIVIETLSATADSVWAFADCGASSWDPRVSFCTPPANDSCHRATTLGLGNGIDPMVLTGTGQANWINGISGTNVCARKVRARAPNCSGTSGNTEDYWWTTAASAFGPICTRLNIGDSRFSCPLGTGTASCFSGIDNDVWFKFQLPPGAISTGWYLNVGGMDCPFGLSQLQVMLMEDVNCGNAQNAKVLNRQTNCFFGLPQTPNKGICGSVNAGGALPSPNGVFGPFNLQPGKDYHILFDGWRYSQCNFQLLLVRTPNDPVLPLTLRSFSGEIQGLRNVLHWETTDEFGTSHFDIERSDDGVNFFKLAESPAAGNSQGIHTYSYEDHDAPAGRALYRLRQVDQDGRFAYSSTVELIRDAISFQVFELFPNPTRDRVQLSFSSPGAHTTRMELLDVAGHVVFDQQMEAQPGANLHEISLQSLPAGVYLLRVSQAAGSSTHKLVKYE